MASTDVVTRRGQSVLLSWINPSTDHWQFRSENPLLWKEILDFLALPGRRAVWSRLSAHFARCSTT